MRQIFAVQCSAAMSPAASKPCWIIQRMATMRREHDHYQVRSSSVDPN